MAMCPNSALRIKKQTNKKTNPQLSFAPSKKRMQKNCQNSDYIKDEIMMKSAYVRPYILYFPTSFSTQEGYHSLSKLPFSFLILIYCVFLILLVTYQLNTILTELLISFVFCPHQEHSHQHLSFSEKKSLSLCNILCISSNLIHIISYIQT